MNADFPVSRRIVLLGLLGAAFSASGLVRRDLEVLPGLATAYVPPQEETVGTGDFYRWGTLTQLAAMTYFPADRNYWSAYLPDVGGIYADNWSLGRLMSTTILQEQARSIVDKSHAPAMTDDMKRTIAGMEEYKVDDAAGVGESFAGQPTRLYSLTKGVWIDDNAWLMRNHLAIYRMLDDRSALDTARQVFAFEVSNWQSQDGCDSGGLPWIQPRAHEPNHDRNTVSNAPVAMAGYELYNITKDPFYLRWALRIHDYQMKYFVDKTTVYDHIDASCRLDTSFWTYTHGVVIGMNRLLHGVLPEGRESLTIAEAIARASIDTFETYQIDRQPSTFVDIYFQELFALYQVTKDDELRARIPRVIVSYAKALWLDTSVHKSNHLFLDKYFDLFEQSPQLHFRPRLVTLGNQAGIANIFYTAACISTVISG